jgi:ornithine--oxo-acid transaminase
MTIESPGVSTAALLAAAEHGATNYSPLPVVLTWGEGAQVRDVEGRVHLDFLAGYSALNFGHRHPRLVEAVRGQLDHLTLTSRAFVHDRFAGFCAAVARLTGKQRVLPMNTGAEAVETAIKLARKWGYTTRGVADGRATVIVAGGNFHGRTTTIVGFSDDPDARSGFGPFTPGFRSVPYGDAEALAAAMDDTVVGVLIEPIQGEAGVVVPPPSYLRRVRELCTRHGVLFLADEVQSGLGRTGTTFAVEHFGVIPDVFILGKALGGGVLPVSAVAADREILDVIRPGQHGSTFGGNPLACAVGEAVVELLETGEYQRHAARVGTVLHDELAALQGKGVTALRGLGLWAGIDIDPSLATGREICEDLLGEGVLAKDTHGSTIRFSPPLVITEEQARTGVQALRTVLERRMAGH